MRTNIDQSPALTDLPFSRQEARALEALRIRFEEDHDLFSSQERARLGFLRWLVDTGRIALSPDAAALQ
jgi:hypothetical protein